MCLVIRKLPKTTEESILVKCTKRLNEGLDNTFFTPFRCCKVPKDGILKVMDYDRNYRHYEPIYGSHIHAYIHALPLLNKEYTAYAINVKAYCTFYNELVCKFLYIPDVDFSGKRVKRVEQLENVLAKGQDMTWRDILKIFPGNHKYFQYGQGYNINVKKTRKDKTMSVNVNTNTKNNAVNWTQMLNEANLTRADLLNFAAGNMTRREFERFGGTARKAVRLLGVSELRKRARKAASRLPV